ncbi:MULTISPECIES: S8 family peptidase [Bacillus]|uniref:S8 family peptidase n=1 Tax=Bacillus TaxID=1386 RepID=UPI0008FE71A9|nr:MULTISPECIES: S8 family serine peptidase [Bacillus]MCC1485874.1 S8 family serine peptidase [Bacillus tropicus]MDA1552549.1 S8 family serine peptidase [Bacillus cereus group sp. TH243-3LC]MDA1563208.1 S8 family serine peptidase [Bacillus cereus group sp. TH243-1LC]MDA1860415.1 S8 family serine peptidase [Bacillus cereus group sp. BY122LC]OJD48707.1 peptidase S8 [Bacillus sp. L27]
MKKKIISFLFVFCIVGSLPNFLHNTYAENLNQNYYTILLQNENNTENFIESLKSYGEQLQITYTIPEIGIVQIYGDQKQVEKIQLDPSVEEITITGSGVIPQQIVVDTPKALLAPNSPSIWDLQWDVKEVTNDGKSYEKFQGTHNVTVGIVDSGIDTTHPDLKESVVAGSKNLVPKGGFRGEEQDETGDINYLEDKRGHGTHTAGLVAANGVMKGVAPGVGIRSYRVFGGGSAEPAWIAKAIVEASKDDVDVINLSLGSYLINGTIYFKDGTKKNESTDIKAYKKAIQYARKMGSVVVAAAGNDGLDVTNKNDMNNFLKEQFAKDDITYKGIGMDAPASLPDVVTVTSTGPTYELSLFSNYGKNFVDITAPGGDLRLFNKYGIDIWMKDGYYQKEQVISTSPNGGYFYGAGTSTATPKVSGALALIIDKYKFKNSPQKSTRFLYEFGVEKSDLQRPNFSGKGQLNIYNLLSK